jgi:hypothetical protein
MKKAKVKLLSVTWRGITATAESGTKCTSGLRRAELSWGFLRALRVLRGSRLI